MANYDPYDRGYSRPSQYVREERHDNRYVDPRDPRDYNYGYQRDMVSHAYPSDHHLTVQEVRRDLAPPSSRDHRRARSADPGHYDDDGYYCYDDYHHDYPSRSRHDVSVHHGDYEHKHKKVISKEDKVIAAVAGAALLVGGKELYDRYEAKEDRTQVKRSPLTSAALASAGALAAYQSAEYYNKVQEKKDHKAYNLLHNRSGHGSEYYSDDDDNGDRKNHSSFLKSAVAATGLGAAVKSLTRGDRDRDDRSDARSHRSSRSRSYSRSSSRSRSSSSSRPKSRRSSRGGAGKIQKAAVASLLAGAAEAFRVSKEPGSWKGEKTKRILTAAAGAAAVDGAHGNDHGKMGLMESVVGGLVGNRLINGPKRDIEEDGRTGRSRSRSRARSQSKGRGSGGSIAALASAGLAKKAYDSYQSRSRSQARSGSRGRHDSQESSPNRRYRSRSRSIVDKARDGLAKLGLGNTATGDDGRDHGSRHSRHRSEVEYHDDYQSRRREDGGSGRRDHHGRGGNHSDSDLGDSSEDDKAHRKLKGKQILAGGLATVATIHAAHGVYSSVQKATARRKAVNRGMMSPEEAKKLKSKAMVHDATSVGIAALGIKSAVDEMKETRDLTLECNDFKHARAYRHQKREERRRKLMEEDGRMRAESESASYRQRFENGDHCHYQPRYYDGNPYRSATQSPGPSGTDSPIANTWGL